MHPGQLNMVENVMACLIKHIQKHLQSNQSESLEINYASIYREIKHTPIFLNHDDSVKITTNNWSPLFKKITQKIDNPP